MDFLEIGTTPHDEPCEQVGENYDRMKAIKECNVFIAQLKRIFGDPPQGCGFRITHGIGVT